MGDEGYKVDDEPELVAQARKRAERRMENIKKVIGPQQFELGVNQTCTDLVQKRERRLRRWAKRLIKEGCACKQEESITCSPGKRPVALDVSPPSDGDEVRPLKRRRAEWFRQQLPWLRGCPTPPKDGFLYLKEVKPWTPIPITPKKASSPSRSSQSHVVKFDEGLLESAAQAICRENGGKLHKEATLALEPETRKDPILDIFNSYNAVRGEGTGSALTHRQNRDMDTTGPFGNVDCLLASDSFGYFPDQQQNEAGHNSSEMDPHNAIEHGRNGIVSAISDSNASVRCSHVGGVQSFEFDPNTKSADDGSTPSMGADKGSWTPVPTNQLDQTEECDLNVSERSPKDQVIEESSLGSWRVTPEQASDDQWSTPGNEDNREGSALSNSAYSKDVTPTQRIWKPPRLATPFNHNPPPPSDASGCSSFRESCMDTAHHTPLQTPVDQIRSRSPLLASPSTEFQTPKSNMVNNINTPSASQQMDAPPSGDVINTSPQSFGALAGFGSPTEQEIENVDVNPVGLDGIECDLGGGLSDSDDDDDRFGGLDDGEDTEGLKVNTESSRQENCGSRMLVNNSTQVSPDFSNVADKSKQPKQRKRRTKVPREPKRRPRNSLCDSNNGRTWVEEEGKEVRRSQRDRHRPLRWWEGEKPIYERRNATMSTVVGYEAWTPEPGKRMVSLERLPSELKMENVLFAPEKPR